MWVTLPDDMDTRDLLALAQDKGVQFLYRRDLLLQRRQAQLPATKLCDRERSRDRRGIRTLGDIIAKRRLRLVRPAVWQTDGL